MKAFFYFYISIRTDLLHSNPKVKQRKKKKKKNSKNDNKSIFPRSLCN